MDNLKFRNNLKIIYGNGLILSLDNLTVYMETAYNSSNSINSTRNLNNRKKLIEKTNSTCKDMLPNMIHENPSHVDNFIATVYKIVSI